MAPIKPYDIIAQLKTRMKIDGKEAPIIITQTQATQTQN